MRRLSLLLMASCLAFGTLCTNAYADKVYRWVDSDGKVHYSSMPPATTAVRAEKVNIAAPPVVSMVVPVIPRLPQQNAKPRTDDGLDKAKADAIDRQIKDMWGQCQVLGQQLDDLRNGVSPNPVTHTKLTDAERAAREQYLEKQLKADCPDGG